MLDGEPARRMAGESNERVRVGLAEWSKASPIQVILGRVRGFESHTQRHIFLFCRE